MLVCVGRLTIEWCVVCLFLPTYRWCKWLPCILNLYSYLLVWTYPYCTVHNTTKMSNYRLLVQVLYFLFEELSPFISSRGHLFNQLLVHAVLDLSVFRMHTICFTCSKVLGAVRDREINLVRHFSDDLTKSLSVIEPILKMTFVAFIFFMLTNLHDSEERYGTRSSAWDCNVWRLQQSEHVCIGWVYLSLVL